MSRIVSRGWRRSVPVSAVCAAIVISTHAFAQPDPFEQTSVIPFSRATEEQPGDHFNVQVVEPGTSARRQRQEAINQLPLRPLPAAAQKEAREILNSLSLYRRLPVIRLQSDRRAYEFFANHPDVAVSIWRAMKISQVQLWQTGANEFETDTRDGSFGTVTVLLRSPSSYLVLCRGQFQSPALPKPIRADALMHLQPRYGEDGTVTHQVDLFVSFPSLTVETLAKIISPVSNRIADRNFEEISLFAELMDRAMSSQPGWIEQLTEEMDGVLPGRTDELLAVTAAVYVSAEKRRRSEAGLPTSLEAIRPPVTAEATEATEATAR